MKTSLKKQQGLTLISIAFILALIGFFTLLTLKIAPIYMNHSKVVSAFEALKNTPEIETFGKYQIINSLDKRFSLNYVDHVKADDITIIKQGKYLRVELEYETVVHIIGNLSVLAEFKEMFEAGTE